MKSIFMPWTVLIPALKHGLFCFESLLEKSGTKSLILVMIGVIVFWHIYTPIHELLHVAACLLGGGTVQELALQPRYGGTLLTHIFPFIVPESEYAGQLTGFTTPNRWVYALVDFFPYILSLFGMALAELCRRKLRPFLFGLAVILAYVPFLSISGDYYEGVSLLTDHLSEWFYPGRGEGLLISDDVFKLVADLNRDGHLDLLTGSLVLLGLVGAVYAAMVTLALQAMLAGVFFRENVLKTVPPGNAKEEPVESISE